MLHGLHKVFVWLSIEGRLPRMSFGLQDLIRISKQLSATEPALDSSW